MNEQRGSAENTVVVFGGGPAGMAAALALVNRGWSVIVLDRPALKHHGLGETILPQARALLSRWGISSESHAGQLESPGMISAWGTDEVYENDHLFNAAGGAWIVDRRLFDQCLRDAAQAAGVVIHGNSQIRACRRQSFGWQIEASSGQSYLDFQARCVIDATGRRGWLANRLGAERLICDRLVACVRCYKLSSADGPVDARPLVEASPSGWWFSTPTSDRSMWAAYFTDRDLLWPRGRVDHCAMFDSAMNEAPHTRSRVANLSAHGPLRLVAAHSYCCSEMAGADWVAVGDTASCIDPLSSQGVYKALRTGLRAAETIEELRHDNREAPAQYTQKMIAEFDDFLLARRHYYGLVTRWRDSPFWQRRTDAQSVKLTKPAH
jgi:flavin-dependent dehydrogenase